MVAVAALATFVVFSLSACGGDDDSVSQEELEAATEEAAEEARKDAKEDAQIADLEDEIDALRKQEGKPEPDSVPPPTDNAGSSGGLPTDAETVDRASLHFQAPRRARLR